jgi:hypothetical protein
VESGCLLLLAGAVQLYGEALSVRKSVDSGPTAISVCGARILRARQFNRNIEV